MCRGRMVWRRLGGWRAQAWRRREAQAGYILGEECRCRCRCRCSKVATHDITLRIMIKVPHF